MKQGRFTGLAALAAGAVLVLAACSGGSSGGAPAAAGAEKGGEGGGDVALTSYRDPSSPISIQYPHTWTKSSDQPLTFSGQDEFVRVEVRSQSGADLLAAAKADEAAVKSQAPGYKPISIASSKDVKGAMVNSYEWDLAGSAVTGKPVHERADRYYINAGGGRIAVVTGSAPAARFDREQFRDIALTLKVAP